MITTAQSQSSENRISCLTALYPKQSTFPPIISPHICHAATSPSYAVTIIPIQNSTQSGGDRHTGTLPRSCGAPALDLDAATLQMRTSSTRSSGCKGSRPITCLNSCGDFYQAAVIIQSVTCGWPGMCHLGKRQRTVCLFWLTCSPERGLCRKCSSDLQRALPINTVF